MSKLRKLPTGGWVADFQDPITGKRRQLSAKTKDLAKARMAHALIEAEEKTKEQTSKSGYSMIEAYKHSMKVRWAGKACERNVKTYASQVVEFFGEGYPIAAVGPQEFERMRTFFRRKGNKPGTINWKSSCLQAMQKDALLYGYINERPELPSRLKCDNTRDRVLTPIEVEGFCSYLRTIGQVEAADLLVFLIEVGCRWSEAEGLIGNRVDLNNGRVYFSKTKNGNPRHVPLTRRAIDAITPHMPAMGRHRVWSFNYKRYQYLFDTCKSKLGLANDIELTIHTCRHTCASRLAIKGISLVAIMKWGGWKSLQAVQRYAHIDLTGLQLAREALEGCDPCGPSPEMPQMLANDLQIYAQ